MSWETVMGLEVHVELSTKTKIFCGCSTDFGASPNAQVCPVCLGMPGTLPVLNREVVEKALRAGLALNCEITTDNRFDRKNYFYPDLPKDYQISQLYHPICTNGYVDLDMGDYTRRVRIHEIHMEEDAGKLIHDASASFVDYNRCGVPLIEIVSEPDLRTADEVAAYLDKLREILVYLDVSDCRMEEGSMRADVNLSVREAQSEAYGTRTETKNMNSVKAIRRAITHEQARQIDILEGGGKVRQETRRWNDDTGESSSMRSKENAQDYRYFPDPDLVPIHIDKAWVATARDSLPELAEQKRERYISSWGITPALAAVLTTERAAAQLFETVTAALSANLTAASEIAGGGIVDAAAGTDSVAGVDAAPGKTSGAEISAAAREAANAISGEVLRLAGELSKDVASLNADPGKIARTLWLVMNGKINRNAGKEVLEAVIRTGADPERYVQEHELEVVTDDGLLEQTVLTVIAENSTSVADYKSGKDKAFGFLVGQTMRALKGKANPQAVNAALKQALETAGVSVVLSAKATGEAASGEARDEGTDSSASDAPAQTNPAGANADGVGTQKEVYVPEIPAWKRKLSSESPDISAEPVALRTSGRYRTHSCGDLREADTGRELRLAGWVHSIRDHGGIVFIDLRDQYGMTQVVVTDEQVKLLGKEMAISVTGVCLKRAEETYNPLIATGAIELKADKIEILGACRNVLPFEIENSQDTKEELRLKYRYLDLRNPKLHDRIVLRAEVIRFLRQSMEALGFIEIQTPILANSSPEGARDYLVPSRKHKGKFYALPQAPQQFKQLLMVSGFDRYYQIAPCFRDEDARLDRSPGEFYQLDFEMAFATQEDVFAVAERVMTDTFRRFSDKPVTQPPYPHIPYKDAMLKYGSDKPDLRNPLIIIDLSKFFAGVDFAPFRENVVRALRVPAAAAQPRSFFRDMEKYALSIGMKGLGYISVQDDGSYKGPIDKFFTDVQRTEIAQLAALEPGDVLYFISDTADKVAGLAGQIRTEIAKRLDLIAQDRYEFCFITDYPMYEFNEETSAIDFTHNPFSMPQGEMEALLSSDPLDILAYQYDIVCNGVELSSGAVRNHRPDVMVKAFEIAGYTEQTVEEKFGALYSAFQYGAPPHAGMAPGVDRIVMLLAEEENIREIIAFPLNSNAQNLMLGAPGEVTEQQLRDVHIKIR